jgi:uncharacterized membrane protein
MSRDAKITFMKTGTYAVMHFVVAIAVAFALTGSIAMALAIGLVEPFVQTIAFAIHERVWSRAVSKPGPMEGMCATPWNGGTRIPIHQCSSLKITSYKTATYAAMHFVVAIAIAYALTGSVATALAIGIIEPLVQTFAFAIHERVWSKAVAAPPSAEQARQGLA